LTQTLIVTSPNWGRIGRGLIMKKIYMQPTMTVVEIKSQAGLLAGSVKTTGLTNPLNYNDGVGNAEEEGM
jgi:hypothetical protein